MNYVQTYGRLVSSFAGRLTDNPQAREEFCQDAYLRIHQLTQRYPDESSKGTEFWHKQVHVAIRNLMLDNARKNNRRRRYYANLDPDKGDPVENHRDPTQNQFEKVSVQKSIEELQRLLPEIEVRILNEMIDPSDGFRTFLKKKRVVQKIWSRDTGVKIITRTGSLSADHSIAEYLEMSPAKFRRHIENINFYATHLI